MIDNIGPVLPRRVIKRWPAIILADSRIAKVPGRITFLIVSIITIKGIRTGGVPWGTKWANILIVLLIHPNSINDSHKGKARANVKTMCLVLVKIYGNSPKKLLNKINLNKEINIRVDPLIEGPIKVLNSLWRALIILIHRILIREGINQNDDGMTSIPIMVLSQFKDIFQLVEGSKEENKFAIIFN